MNRFCLYLVLVRQRSWWIWFSVFFISLSFALSHDSAQALTQSLGQPYHGRLVEGIPFPSQFRGYQLREEGHTFTTPEVVGALLDAIEAVRRQYSNTCDIYLGDFSREGGGFVNHHRSHQNGRDVDIGMYARDNHALNTLVPMNEDNLDVPKTWCLIENILHSQRVQYVFLDRRIQKLLYDYALSHGVDQGYLDQLFGNTRGSIIQHVARHYDHMHIRFFTPWSTMAAHMGGMDDRKKAVIEMAQQAYLPKKVLYYAKSSEMGIDALAQSFGVNRNDLCRWNQLRGADVVTPGSCLVFYKRGFELEPVHLAQSIRPDSVPESTVQFASLRSSGSVSDITPAFRNAGLKGKKADSRVVLTCTAKRGDTLDRIAKRTGTELKSLLELNGMKKNTVLRPGQKVKLVSLKSPDVPAAKQGAAISKAPDNRSSKPELHPKRTASAAPAPVVTKGKSPSKTGSLTSTSKKQPSTRAVASPKSSSHDKAISSKASHTSKTSSSNSAQSKAQNKPAAVSKTTAKGKPGTPNAQAPKKKGGLG